MPASYPEQKLCWKKFNASTFDNDNIKSEQPPTYTKRLSEWLVITTKDNKLQKLVF